MSHNRREEKPRIHFRSDRCVEFRGSWFVTTREGIDVGPYPTREAASIAAAQIVELLSEIDDPAIAQTFIREYLRRRQNWPVSSGAR